MGALGCFWVPGYTRKLNKRGMSQASVIPGEGEGKVLSVFFRGSRVNKVDFLF